MKRIKSAVILQTLVFSQKEEAGLSPEQALQLNQADLENYKLHLERTRTRYQIVSEEEQEDDAYIPADTSFSKHTERSTS